MDNEKRDSIRLEVKSHPRYLSLIRSVTFALAKIAGFTDDDAKDLKLVMDEACTNIIKHSYHYDYTKPIVINFYLNSNEFEVLIQDFGEKVDPSKIKSRKMDVVRPGGLGVYIMKKLADVMEYDPAGCDGPRLRLIKYKKKG